MQTGLYCKLLCTRPEMEARVAESPDPGLLEEVRSLRRRARNARRAYWFPLVTFGVLTLLATPLYSPASPSTAPSGPQSIGVFASGMLAHPNQIAQYWLVALPVGYLVTLWYYQFRSVYTGVMSRIGPFIWSGLGLVLAATAGYFLYLLPTTYHGTLALIVLAGGLHVLAWLERSWLLEVFAVFFTAIALLANFYDLENVISLGWYSNTLPNILIPGLVLTLAGILFRATGYRRS